jgi:hypothetical protein
MSTLPQKRAREVIGAKGERLPKIREDPCVLVFKEDFVAANLVYSTIKSELNHLASRRYLNGNSLFSLAYAILCACTSWKT